MVLSLGMALDSQEEMLRAGLRGSSLLLVVAIRAHSSGCLSGRTSCKHEKIGRGVAAPEIPREARAGEGFCASPCVTAWITWVPCHSHCLSQAHLVTWGIKGCYCSPGAQLRFVPSPLPASHPTGASKFPFLQRWRLESCGAPHSSWE